MTATLWPTTCSGCAHNPTCTQNDCTEQGLEREQHAAPTCIVIDSENTGRVSRRNYRLTHQRTAAAQRDHSKQMPLKNRRGDERTRYSRRVIFFPHEYTSTKGVGRFLHKFLPFPCIQSKHCRQSWRRKTYLEGHPVSHCPVSFLRGETVGATLAILKILFSVATCTSRRET